MRVLFGWCNRVTAALALVVAIGALGQWRDAVAGAGSREDHVMSLAIVSSAFKPHTAIPAKYTCDGADISPPLSWSGIPAGTKSLALIVDDPDAPDPAAPKMTWVHWVLYNIPP